MKRIILFFFFLHIYVVLPAQSYVFTDLGSLILKRPNLGFETFKNDISYTAALRYQRNYISSSGEFPVDLSAGLGIDFGTKPYSVSGELPWNVVEEDVLKNYPKQIGMNFIPHVQLRL